MRTEGLNSRQVPGGRPAAVATVSSAYLRMLAWGAEAHGLAPARILSGAGVDPGVLEQRGGRAPLAPVLRAWEQFAERVDTHVGLRFVDVLPFGTGGLIDYLVRSARTLGESLQQLARYAAPLMNQSDQLALVVSGNQANMRIHTAGSGPYNTELLTGLFASRSRAMYSPSWTVRSVSFAHGQRGPMALYERLFQAPVRFDMPFARMILNRNCSTCRCPTPTPASMACSRARSTTWWPR